MLAEFIMSVRCHVIASISSLFLAFSSSACKMSLLLEFL